MFTHDIPAGLFGLARALEAEWPQRMDAIKASGCPTAAYDNIISRTDSQALIPEDVSLAMLESLPEQSAVLSLFPRIPVATNQTRLPIISALPTAYFVNGDTGLKQTTEMAWANRYLNVEELAAIVPIPEAVLDDAGFDIWAAVRPRLEEAVGRAIDAAIFFAVNKPASWHERCRRRWHRGGLQPDVRARRGGRLRGQRCDRPHYVQVASAWRAWL
jgi:hypothetical protein